MCFLFSIVAHSFFALAMIQSPATLPSTSPSTAPATQPSTIAREMAKIESDFRQLPQRKLESIAQAIRIERNADSIVARSQIKDIDQTTRLVVADLPGFTTLTYDSSPAAGADEYRAFSFTNRNVVSGANQSTVESILSVSFAAGHLVMAHDVEDGNEVVSVQLICDPPPEPDTGDVVDPLVKLYIARFKQAGTNHDAQVTRTANSFRELWLKFPDDVNRYLRPALRELKSEASVFTPDANMAWQVLKGDWQPDPALEERVTVLSKKLDSSDFQQRSEAESKIRELGAPGAVVLSRIDRAKLSPQLRNAIDSILESYFSLSAADAKRLCDDRFFLLDALSSDDVTLRTLAWKRYQTITKTALPFDPASDEKNRTAAIEKLRE